MCYILLNRLLKIDISEFTDISFSNKFLDRERKRNMIFRLINYYIDTNNIIYIDDIKKENDD